MPNKPPSYRPPGSRPSGTQQLKTTQRGYGWRWQQLRERVLIEEPLCSECRKEGVVCAAEHVDHIVPKSQGGTDDRSNLSALCPRHHDIKSVLDRAAAAQAKQG